VVMAAVSELAELSQMALDRSPQARRSLVGRVTDFYFRRGNDLTPRERALVTDILRELLRDSARDVRRALAERLAGEATAPRDLVIALANDEAPVARPVLARSPVLTDGDLVAVVRSHDSQHQRAVAVRPALSIAVTDALVDVGDHDVISVLLGNHGASLGDSAMARLVERSRTVEVWQGLLLERPEMQRDLALRMYAWVTASLRQQILAVYNINPRELDDYLSDTIDGLTRPSSRNQGVTEEMTARAQNMARRGEITPAALVEVLRRGDVVLFCVLLGQIIHTPPEDVRSMIDEPGGRALAVACRVAGINGQSFASLFLLSRRARPGEQLVDQLELSRALAFHSRLTEAEAATELERRRTATVQ
jgi:uncharacterized protein (DUF2336 family)